MYEKVKDGIFYNPKFGRVVNHKGYSTSIHWSQSMLDYLCRHFPTTLNEELAGCLGVSVRTMIRKARELNLEKDKDWLESVWNERRILANLSSKRKGYPGRFKKGEHANPGGEFKKGHQESEETKQKRSSSLKRWCMFNHTKVKLKNQKAAETRRRNDTEGTVPSV